jgi:hypothetical protein
MTSNFAHRDVGEYLRDEVSTNSVFDQDGTNLSLSHIGYAVLSRIANLTNTVLLLLLQLYVWNAAENDSNPTEKTTKATGI